MQHNADLTQPMLTAVFPSNISVEFRRYVTEGKEASRDHDIIVIDWHDKLKEYDGSTVNEPHSVAMSRHEFEMLKSLVEQTDSLPTTALSTFEQEER